MHSHHIVRGYFSTQQLFPICYHFEQRFGGDQTIIFAKEMGPGTTPPVILGFCDQMCPNRVELHISCRCKKVILTQRERGETSLPEITLPSFSEIDHAGITPMSFSYRSGQTILCLRNRDQMNMVRHKAIRPNFDIIFPTPLAHQGDIVFIVPIIEKRFHTTYPTLGDMVRYAWNYHSSYSCHNLQYGSSGRYCLKR